MHNLTSTAVQHQGALKLVFGMTVAYLVVEIVTGLLANSLALLADAGHMLADAGSLGLALFAVRMSQKPPTPERTYGYYRIEILAALVNAVVLCLVSVSIFYEAYQRLQKPSHVIGLPMLITATVGLIVNIIGARKLHNGAQESLNIKGAFLEVLSDTFGSLAVMVAAVIMMTTGWHYVDPLVSVFFALFILPRVWKLVTQSVNILIEATPRHIDLQEIEAELLDLENVTSVHDLHAWTITSGFEALSTHLVLLRKTDAKKAQEILEQAGDLLRKKFDIGHTTIQLEYRDLQQDEQQV